MDDFENIPYLELYLTKHTYGSEKAFGKKVSTFHFTATIPVVADGMEVQRVGEYLRTNPARLHIASLEAEVGLLEREELLAQTTRQAEEITRLKQRIAQLEHDTEAPGRLVTNFW